MPNISWNEIRNGALLFSRRWSEATREQAEMQSFWNDFFDVFGLARRTVASFQEPVRRITGTTGFIDLFWPGKLLVEHKTAGHSLDAAESQAFAYIRDLVNSGRQDEVPRYVLLSDFRRFALYDLEPEEQLDLPLFHGLHFHRIEFPLGDLRDHVLAFAFIPGYKLHRFTEQDPANLKAVALMAALHDTLRAGGYTGHDLERLLVRILFCLFAEDTGIFEPLRSNFTSKIAHSATARTLARGLINFFVSLTRHRSEDSITSTRPLLLFHTSMVHSFRNS